MKTIKYLFVGVYHWSFPLLQKNLLFPEKHLLRLQDEKSTSDINTAPKAHSMWSVSGIGWWVEGGVNDGEDRKMRNLLRYLWIGWKVGVLYIGGYNGGAWSASCASF